MSEEEYEEVQDVPLHHMKPFGSGLRRNEIKFVPASNEESVATEEAKGKSSGQNVRDFYLNMVLKKPAADTEKPKEAKETDIEICEICKMPLTSARTADSKSNINGGKASHHESSIAHQVCLTHSHPPSALDRNRMGLSVLEAAGWDPDARTGLGATGQGVQYPVKAKPKEDKFGVGVVMPKDFQVKRQKEKPKTLDAKKVRKMAADDRKRTDKLQQQIFGKVDLEKYLGKGA
ncbi:hypothetical protein N0V82_001592 [Gnomoniopsis sp. IMI 355080]|nr:hypothetical protein N0V82_001592 [Gnomoniopsis sp. IMI 355080]